MCHFWSHTVSDLIPSDSTPRLTSFSLTLNNIFKYVWSFLKGATEQSAMFKYNWPKNVAQSTTQPCSSYHPLPQPPLSSLDTHGRADHLVTMVTGMKCPPGVHMYSLSLLYTHTRLHKYTFVNNLKYTWWRALKTKTKMIVWEFTDKHRHVIIF